MSEEKLVCDNCGKQDCEELVTRQGFKTTFYCEFVCHDCFVELEGVPFNDYGAWDYYGTEEKAL